MNEHSLHNSNFFVKMQTFFALFQAKFIKRNQTKMNEMKKYFVDTKEKVLFFYNFQKDESQIESEL